MYLGATRFLSLPGLEYSMNKMSNESIPAAIAGSHRGNCPAAATIDDKINKKEPKTACSFAQRPNSIRAIPNFNLKFYFLKILRKIKYIFNKQTTILYKVYTKEKAAKEDGLLIGSLRDPYYY